MYLHALIRQFMGGGNAIGNLGVFPAGHDVISVLDVVDQVAASDFLWGRIKPVLFVPVVLLQPQSSELTEGWLSMIVADNMSCRFRGYGIGIRVEIEMHPENVTAQVVGRANST